MLNKNKTIFIRRLSFGFSFVFLGFIASRFLFPAVPSNAATSASLTADLELEIEPTIEVAVSTSSLDLSYNGETEILPTSAGVVATGDIDVYVTTNSSAGYSLSLYTQNATNEMKNINSSVATSIAPTIGGATLAGNTWGFQYDGGNWTPVSDDASDPSVIIADDTAPSSFCADLATNYASCYANNAAKKTTVTFGAKITDSLPAGKYTNDVVFSAIAKTPAPAPSVSYMQDFSCSSLASGESTTLVDKRDNAEYTVKKFGTGASAECWMTSNLTLGYDQANNVAKGYTLTKDDTNIPDNTTYYLPPAGKRGSVTSSGTVTATNAAVFDSSTAVSEAHVQYRAADQSSTGTLFQNTGYYNYPAATLGYSYYNDGLSSGNAPRDICPAGWQLPRGSSTSTYSFYWLDTTLGGTGANRTDTTARDKFLNDASFGYSGLYLSSQLYNVGLDGNWWSSTLSSSTYAYNMYLYSDGDVYPQSSNSNKYYGFAVRCVAKEESTSHTVTINSGTGISSVSGAGAYSVGSTVNISATPSSGYNFSSWTVNSGGASLASTTSSSTSFTMPDADVTITANGVSATPTCSASVHPTITTGCKMADGKTWVYGNDGNAAVWTDLFTNATNQNNHDATLISGKCPSDYSAPKKSDYDTLVASYSGGGLYTALGLSGGRTFWSSTERGSGYAYRLGVSSSDAFTGYTSNSYSYYLLCVK